MNLYSELSRLAHNFDQIIAIEFGRNPLNPQCIPEAIIHNLIHFKNKYFALDYDRYDFYVDLERIVYTESTAYNIVPPLIAWTPDRIITTFFSPLFQTKSIVPKGRLYWLVYPTTPTPFKPTWK